MIAEALMTRDPITIRSTQRLREAVEALQAAEVRHLPVVDDQGELVGMLSDRDLRGLAWPSVSGGEYLGAIGSLEGSVSALMTSDVISVGTDDDVRDVIELMLQNRVGAVPVIDGDGALVGIVSYVDILRWASDELAG